MFLFSELRALIDLSILSTLLSNTRYTVLHKLGMQQTPDISSLDR